MEKQKHHTSPHITALSLFHNDNNQIILHTHHNRPPLYFYTMHGLKLFGITALAANKGSIEKNLNGLKSVGTPLRPVDGVVSGRREALGAIFLGAAAFSSPSIANALDMDAFMNSELESDTKNCDPKKDPKCAPKMTQDEGLCKYGQSGNARAEACKRFKATGGKVDRPAQGKSLGGAYAM